MVVSSLECCITFCRRLAGTLFRDAHEFAEDRTVIAIRQIHEQLANVIEVPAELRNRRTEVIFLAIDTADATRTDEPCRTADQFYGLLPDFPERVAQAEFETRLEFKLGRISGLVVEDWEQSS